MSVLTVLAILFYFFNPEEVLFPKCPLYATTGIYCPGCGSQRALHDLLHLDIAGVWHHNPLFIIGGLFILYYWVVVVLNKCTKVHYYNYIYHPKTPWIVLIIVLLFWLLRNLPWTPFTSLAPH
ncbi:DUF2752 domain-containing protein [Urechidicola sp. KH5]